MFIKKYFIFFLLFIFSNISLFTQSPSFPGGPGDSKDNGYELWNKEHLMELGDSVLNSHYPNYSIWHYGKHFLLMQDIDTIKQNIASFRGYFHGNRKKAVAYLEEICLFNGIIDGGTLDSLIFEGYINNAAGIVAFITSSYAMPPLPLSIVSHCINNATFIGDSAWSPITNTWYYYPAAGIAYQNSGIISHCINNGSVSGVDRIGGIAGDNNGTIENA